MQDADVSLSIATGKRVDVQGAALILFENKTKQDPPERQACCSSWSPSNPFSSSSPKTPLPLYSLRPNPEEASL